VLVITSLGHFINDGMVFFVPVIADLLAKGHGISSVVVTAMLTVFYLASAGFGIVVGLVADRIGRRGAMIAFGLLVLSVGLLGFYVALVVPHGFGRTVVVVAAALVTGIGSSFYHPLAGSLLQLRFSSRSRGRALGVNGSFGSLGRALYPSLFFVVAALAISQADTVAIFAGFGVLTAVVVATGLRQSALVMAEPTPGATEAPVVTEQTGSTEAPVVTEQTAPTTAPQTAGAARGLPIRSILNRSVVTLMAIAFFRSLAFIGIVSWVPIYLSTQRHVGVSTDLGYTVTVMYLGGILGQPSFGLLADRFDKRIVLAVDSLGSAAATFLYLSTSGPAATVALLIFGFFTFSGFPLLLSLVSDYVPRESSTTGNALVWGVGSTGGQALGPLAVSLITLGSYKRLGFAFGILAVIAAATVLATPMMARSSRHGHMSLFG
jgi:MFS family permease